MKKKTRKIFALTLFLFIYLSVSLSLSISLSIAIFIKILFRLHFQPLIQSSTQPEINQLKMEKKIIERE